MPVIIHTVDPKQQLDDDFFAYEFMCSCGCKTCRMASETISGLQEMRNLADAAIHINSGYRCLKHKESKKRLAAHKPPSKHTEGLAADIVVAGMDVLGMLKLALSVSTFRDGGIGIYPDMHFLHVDCGPKRRWAYLKNMEIPFKEGLRCLGLSEEEIKALS